MRLPNPIPLRLWLAISYSHGIPPGVSDGLARQEFNHGGVKVSFDFVSLFNIIFGSVLGAMASWMVSHHYWKKNSSSERILKEIKRILPVFFMPLRHPQFYSDDTQTAVPEQPSPANPDIPHVVNAVFSKKIIKEGDQVEVLLEIRDHGINLVIPNGVFARDHLERNVAAKICGIGYASISFKADAAQHQQNKITITLKDTAGNENTQSISFSIHK